MSTKLIGKTIFLRMPLDTAKGLDHIANSLGVKSTQLINIIIYANPEFKCNAYTEALANFKLDKNKAVQKMVLRMGPYAEQIAIAGSKRNDTFVGTWVKALLAEKVKEWEEGGNILNGGKGSKLFKGQQLPQRVTG